MSDAINTLFAQHRDCDELLSALETELRKPDWPAAQIAFALANEMIQAHLDMEEERLFPAFEQATGMVGGPTRVMRMEHDDMRDLLVAAQEAILAQDAETALAEIDTLLILIQQHNTKEQNVLYPLCQAHVAEIDNLIGLDTPLSDAQAALRK